MPTSHARTRALWLVKMKSIDLEVCGVRKRELVEQVVFERIETHE